jgi:hypothetical protein
LYGQTGRLKRFIHDFEKYPLLRIDGVCFFRFDVEKVRVELADILAQKVRISDIGGSMVIGVPVIEGFRIESVLRYLGEEVAWFD